jgi:hypothetical protein
VFQAVAAPKTKIKGANQALFRYKLLVMADRLEKKHHFRP